LEFRRGLFRSAIAGNASTNAIAALPASSCLIRGGIGSDVVLDGLDRNFLCALGQQEQPADQQEDNYNQNDEASRHCDSTWSAVCERLLPDLEPLCIAPDRAKADRHSGSTDRAGGAYGRRQIDHWPPPGKASRPAIRRQRQRN